ncbi:MAG: HEAT repeat domain-containing protein [Thermodesulfovibrionales bacterium]|nr:HEAT repeat domain-containing protein [Thermodesulfovibrionales bacterium]
MSNRVRRYLKNLSDPNEAKRRAAAEALATADERAIYPLIKALRDENPGVQDAAMRSLISIGGEATAYMVLPLLREDALIRNIAMIILREIGQVTVPLLRHLLKDKDDDVRKFAIDLIIDINHCDYLDDLITLLNEDKNANVRASAAKALGTFKYQKAVPYLIKALQDDEWVAFSSLEALALIKDEKSITSISSLLSCSSDILRFSAIETLGKIGTSLAEKYLLEYYSKAEEYEKTAIIKSLLHMGKTPNITGAKDILIDIYKEGEWDERLMALKGLVELKEVSSIPLILDIAGSLDPSVPDEMDILYSIKEILKGFDCAEPLIDALKDSTLRYKAKTLAIEIIGDQNCKEAIPSLLKLFEDELRDVKRATVKALEKLDPQGIEEFFLKASESDDGHIRKNAISAIGRIGDKAVVEKLFKLWDTEVYPDVKEEIIKAILTINPKQTYESLERFDVKGKELIARYTMDINLLKALSKDEDINVRLSAINSLGLLNLLEAQEILIAYLKDKDTEIRKAALMALGNIRCCPVEVIPLLNDEDMWVRIYAIKALANSSDPEVIDYLKPMLTTKEIPVLLSAIDALYKIATDNAIDISYILRPLLNHGIPAIRKKVQELEGIL